jgi:hypothetical protein
LRIALRVILEEFFAGRRIAGRRGLCSLAITGRTLMELDTEVSV